MGSAKQRLLLAQARQIRAAAREEAAVLQALVDAGRRANVKQAVERQSA